MRYVIANWKMNMTLKKVNMWLNEFEKLITETPNTTIVLAPSLIHISIVKFFADKYSNIKIAAQDVSFKEIGAHTGETGAEQLKEFCEYCIVGHSELNEDENTKNNKAKVCLDNQINPILCSKTPDVSWKNIDDNYLLAWENPANISKDGVYNEKPQQEIEKEINRLVEKEGHSNVIYGGSVNEENSLELSKINNLTGVLVGNASLNPKTFWQIVQNFENNGA